MTVWNWPTTAERSARATAHLKKPWRCEWCGRRIEYAGGWQIAAHKQACHMRPKKLKSAP